MDVKNDITHPDFPIALVLDFLGMIQKTNMLAKPRGLMDIRQANRVPVIKKLERGVPRVPSTVTPRSAVAR